MRFCLFLVACAALLAACDNLAGDVVWPSYTVVYHANDGTGRTRTYTYRHLTNNYLNGRMFDRVGHTIYGWAGNPSGEVKATCRDSVNNLVTRAEQTIDLFAVWQPNTYRVFYDPNGGEGEMEHSVFTFDEAGNLRGNAFVNDFYIFHGWARSPDAREWEFADQAGVINLTAEYNSTVTLYAMWGPQYLTITFAANGGDGAAPGAREISPGSILLLPGAEGLSRIGYFFLGWGKDPLGEGDILGAGYSLTIRVTGDITLYAMWGDRRYIVTFDANSAEGTPPSLPPMEVGASTAIPGAEGLSMYGHNFGGWNTQADGGGRNFAAGAQFVMEGGDLTLYAMWHPIGAVFTVTFSGNGGEGQMPHPNPQTINAGASMWLPAVQLTKSGYAFGGWNTEADGSGYNFNTGDSFTPTGNATLYARWIPRFTVSFNANNAEGTPPAAQTVDAGNNITIPGPGELSNLGFTFGGWNTEANGAGRNFTAGEWFAPIETVTLYAVWNLIGAVFTVSFDANAGTGATPNPQTVDAGGSITVPGVEELSNLGYAFGGWNTQSNGAGHNFNPGDTFTPTGNATLYAVWITRFAVSFNANNAGGTPPAPRMVTAGDNVELPGAGGLSIPGFVFGGWNTEANGTGNNFNPGNTFTPTGNITLYAVWNPVGGVAVTVSFNANGGIGTPPNPQTVTTGVFITVPGPGGLSKEGHTFSGWNISADGSGPTFPSDLVFPLINDLTLFAMWYPAVTEGNFNISFADFQNIETETTGPIVSILGIPQTITVTNPEQYDPGSIRWFWEGIEIDATPGGAVSGVNGGTLTLDHRIHGNQIRTHRITVVVRKDNVPYSKIITFAVVP